MEYFIEQDRRIKFLKIEVKILKAKEEKLEKELIKKWDIEELKEYIQKVE